MAKEMRIDDALIRLNEGKFSFQMSDCIAAHIVAQSRQIDALTVLNDRHRFDIMQRDLQIHLLEKEVDDLKKLFLRAIWLHGVISQAMETATGAKEKLRALDGASVRFWIDDIKKKLLTPGAHSGLGIVQVQKVLQYQVGEAVQSFEKFTDIILSKFKPIA
jgi:hypothetical protein